jgi:FMN reductase
MSGAVRIVTIVGNPRVHSRTRLAAEAVAGGIAHVAESAGRAPERITFDLADLAPELFNYPSTTVEGALDTVRGATVLVVASPTYKATYTGLLKVFLDRLPGNALEGIVAVPMMLGGAPNHLLAVDVFLRPVLLELGATCSTRGLFVQESELEALDTVVERFCSANRAALRAAFGPA